MGTEGATCLVMGHSTVQETKDTWQKHTSEEAAPGLKRRVPPLFLPIQDPEQPGIPSAHAQMCAQDHGLGAHEGVVCWGSPAREAARAWGLCTWLTLARKPRSPAAQPPHL